MSKARAPESTRGGGGQRRHLRDAAVPVRFADAEHGHRRLGAASRARSVVVTMIAPPPSVTRQQSATVSGSLTMREASTSVDRERIGAERARGQARPLARGDGNRRQLLARGAELVHVPGGRQRVHRDRVARPVRRLVEVGKRRA